MLTDWLDLDLPIADDDPRLVSAIQSAERDLERDEDPDEAERAFAARWMTRN
jgi:hypothetical protein